MEKNANKETTAEKVPISGIITLIFKFAVQCDSGFTPQVNIRIYTDKNKDYYV